jgi:excisionase family DNA binding protein
MARTVSPRRDHGETAALGHAWTKEAVHGLGLTTTVDTAASILGISRTKAYELAKTGTFPVRLVRVGRRYLVHVLALLDLLGGQPHARP